MFNLINLHSGLVCVTVTNGVACDAGKPVLGDGDIEGEPRVVILGLTRGARNDYAQGRVCGRVGWNVSLSPTGSTEKGVMTRRKQILGSAVNV